MAAILECAFPDRKCFAKGQTPKQKIRVLKDYYEHHWEDLDDEGEMLGTFNPPIHRKKRKALVKQDNKR